MTKATTKVIGITGPSGAGKSLFRSFLEQQGFPCIDADGVYHDLLIPPSVCLDHLRQAFGDSVFQSDGSLDRKALGEIVFHDPKQLDLLNNTVLPYVLDQIRNLIGQNASASLVFVDAPTLIESGFHLECDAVISILAEEETRAERIAKRDHLSINQAHTRIHAQQPDSFYIDHSDYVLQNDGDQESFLAQSELILRKLMGKESS